ncbi:MAG: hypothetical protein UHM08_08990 [Bacteroidales bacterium]|nr:hypothetical protein [Bacteroidales bacterium]
MGIGDIKMMEDGDTMALFMSAPLIKICSDMIEYMESEGLTEKETVLEFTDVKFTVKCELKEEETTEMEEKQ